MTKNIGFCKEGKKCILAWTFFTAERIAEPQKVKYQKKWQMFSKINGRSFLKECEVNLKFRVVTFSSKLSIIQTIQGRGKKHCGWPKHSIKD